MLPGDLLTSSENLTITAFEKVERDGDNFSLEQGEAFTALVNPESYSEEYSISYQKNKVINASGQRMRYNRSKPRTMNLQLILDGTGATQTGLEIGPFSTGQTVEEQVDAFLKLCYHYNGKIHEPNFLKLVWGRLNFSCKLKKVNVTYSLFDKGGKPFRAILDTVFIEDKSDEERRKEENQSSPDVTHAHLVIGGDTLPIISRRVYGTSEYYLKLAAFNELDHFRELKPGTEIRLPPLEVLNSLEV